MQETLSGGVGIKSKNLSFYNNTDCDLTVTGGDGSIGDSQPGNGGSPINTSNMACIYNTGTTITFKGGMGGANRNSDYGGLGYKFSAALRALYEPKGITCIDGEDYRAGNSTT